jgi:hypothetical protein
VVVFMVVVAAVYLTMLELNGWIVLNNELESEGKKAVVAEFCNSYYCDISLEGLGKTAKM